MHAADICLDGCDVATSCWHVSHMHGSVVSLASSSCHWRQL
jgi:hypothetical protein